ncbi:hypothetical protein HHK36_007727 [Tetracentron sinense]|uniref:Nuclease HARBI1 n=1 Tax=Tetracentron sinense TaxID=13715 RepID=A0A834ZL20_TETSI|nr:hypothetical protein HHK36_007727 [Tetracentron sinense]
MLVVVALQQEQSNAERRTRPRRGFIQGHSTIRSDRVKGHERLYNDYFAGNPVYSSIQFRMKFRMSRPLFLRIQSAIEAHDLYFILKRNATGTLGISSLQKVTAAMRMLVYGVATDVVDDYVRIGESTLIESLIRFVRAVVEVFGEEYLRSPNNDDISRLLAQGDACGFPGMLGSIDCMHWKWKNCPVAWKCQYEMGGHHDPSIILEVVASYDLWILHAFFGLPGSHNDINVLERSPLFTNLIQRASPPINYSINGHDYTMG